MANVNTVAVGVYWQVVLRMIDEAM